MNIGYIRVSRDKQATTLREIAYNKSRCLTLAQKSVISVFSPIFVQKRQKSKWAVQCSLPTCVYYVEFPHGMCV